MRHWNGDIYSPNLDLADDAFKKENYGDARCRYEACLDYTKKFTPNHKQKIEYIEDKIQQCIENQCKHK